MATFPKPGRAGAPRKVTSEAGELCGAAWQTAVRVLQADSTASAQAPGQECACDVMAGPRDRKEQGSTLRAGAGLPLCEAPAILAWRSPAKGAPLPGSRLPSRSSVLPRGWPWSFGPARQLGSHAGQFPPVDTCGVSPQLPKGLATLSGCCSYSRGHKVLRTEEFPRPAGDVRVALPTSLNPFLEQPGAEQRAREAGPVAWAGVRPTDWQPGCSGGGARARGRLCAGVALSSLVPTAGP